MKRDTAITKAMRQRGEAALNEAAVLRRAQFKRLSELKLATAAEVKSLTIEASLLASYERIDPTVTGQHGLRIRALLAEAHAVDANLMALNAPGIPAAKFLLR